MADENEDDLVIETETEEKLPVDPPVEPPKVVEPEEGIEALKAQLAASQQREAEANARARDAGKSAERAAEVHDTNLAMVTQAIDTLKTNKDTLKANYAAAAAAGDWDAAAEAQEGMADTAAKLLALEQGKENLEARAKEPPVVDLPSDPVEALAIQLSPRSASWVRSHPEFARDNRKYQAMIAAHNLALANGLEADSDAYFADIEEKLKVRAPVREDAREEALSEAAKPVQERENRGAPPAAPVSRGNGSERTVRLSAAEVEMAEMMGMSSAEYAKNKVALKNEGKLN